MLSSAQPLAVGGFHTVVTTVFERIVAVDGLQCNKVFSCPWHRIIVLKAAFILSLRPMYSQGFMALLA